MYANRAAAAQTISNKNMYVDKLLLSSILRSDHSVAGLFLSSVSLLSAEIATGINGEIFPWCICLAQCFCCFRLMLTKLSYNNLLHTHTESLKAFIRDSQSSRHKLFKTLIHQPDYFIHSLPVYLNVCLCVYLSQLKQLKKDNTLFCLSSLFQFPPVIWSQRKTGRNPSFALKAAAALLWDFMLLKALYCVQNV